MTSENGPSVRWGHTLSRVNDSSSVLIGGQGDKSQFCRDSIWYLNMDAATWKPLDSRADGPKPEARMGHTAIFDPTMRCIYLFGGSKQKKWFNDVHMLDTDERKWSLVKANGKAPTRSYHSCTLYRHELWIFGGVFPLPDPQPDGCSNDVHVFSPVCESWYDPIVMGERPCPRSGHSATLLGDRLVVFGGWDAPVCFNDVHVLDLCIVEWAKLETRGTPPSPRSWHGSTNLTGNRLLIQGGYNGNDALSDTFILNMDTVSWTQVHLQPPLIPRAGHTTLCLPFSHTQENKDKILIFGGGDNEGSFYNDLLEIMIPFETENVLR
ncbi:hypothetical protein CAPTEDRAFT_93513 [Capitella teleta]|uniref:Uncharacterized protein n=1 Tax=Capitella teleta TaxID=283909 RepID=R7UK24_CAPTE|nr:hypothetical protein CAPTEDRAFT_93513 [Capitella teleta]|eukprot:ELU04148.1 hypothetical protein CAPTEDRAFT_93513 [Capitella teleta]